MPLKNIINSLPRLTFSFLLLLAMGLSTLGYSGQSYFSPMNKGLTLITMGQGNTKVLRETLESFKGVVDEVIYGDVLIFDSCRKTVESYQAEYNLKAFRLPFNYIFQMGFANTLNYLAANASNDFVIYMNTSEVISEDYGITETIKSNPNCNAFFFDHATDPHRWFRCYNKNELQWQGYIHEEIVPIKGDIKPYHKPIFRMKDLEKDMGDSFKAAVWNSCKEAVYFENYMRLVDSPVLARGTNEGWIKFAKDQYASMKERLEQKGKQYEAFKTGDIELLLSDISLSDYFAKERFESSKLINFQGARKDIL